MKLSDVKNGTRFGRLVVIGRELVRVGKARETATMLVLRCDCGNERRALLVKLLRTKVPSCGCARGVATRTHGESRRTDRGKRTRSQLYSVWSSMIQRCINPKNPQYPNYGGRGIVVCVRWRDSFENFRADVGERPSSRHSLDRVDNDGDYRPDNVRWALPVEQSRNSRKLKLADDQVAEARRLVAGGMSRKAVAERFGVSATYIGALVLGHRRATKGR